MKKKIVFFFFFWKFSFLLVVKFSIYLNRRVFVMTCLKDSHYIRIIIFNKAGRLIKSTFKFQNEVIECVKSYWYLGLYFSASGSFSYAKSEFYKKGLKAYFKLCKNILNLHPSIWTSLHLFDHTVKPIFLVKYGELIILPVQNFEMEFLLTKFLILVI